MKTATYNDLMLARQQGSITETYHGDLAFLAESSVPLSMNSDLKFFIISCSVFGVGFLLLLAAIARFCYKEKDSTFVEPLISNEEAVDA
jgi:hypothetical protein